MEEWKEYKLGEITDIQTGPFGSQLHQRDYVDVGTPCIMPTNIGTHLDIKPEGIAHVKEEDVARLNKHCVKAGDIIYSRRGDIEKCAFISKHEEGWLCGTGCLRIRINSLSANPHFIAYQLSTKECKKWIVGNAVGTTMLNLNTGILKELPLLMPDRQLQDSVVKILQSLDDKIEVNRRINDNLEQQAQALFKSWFVDFEPFRNQSFIASEIGMIPKEWKIANLSSIADYINGLAMQKYRPSKDETGLPVLKIKELGQGCCDDNSEQCSPSLIGENHVINDGDIIFSWSGTLMVKIWCGGKCGLNQHLFVVKPYDTPKWFAYQWTKHHLDNFIQIAKDKAVTMGHIKRGELDKAKVLIPDKDNFAKISSIMMPIHQQIISHEIESRHLASLRDSLLPRLMSGELKVCDVTI